MELNVHQSEIFLCTLDGAKGKRKQRMITAAANKRYANGI
jgi:hypothetical protein